MTRELQNAAVRQIAAMREEVGDQPNICFDVNVNSKSESQIHLARAPEPDDLMWLQLDNLNAESCRMVKDATRTPIYTASKTGSRQLRAILRAQCYGLGEGGCPVAGVHTGSPPREHGRDVRRERSPSQLQQPPLDVPHVELLRLSVTNVRISESDHGGTDLKEDDAKRYAYTT